MPSNRLASDLSDFQSAYKLRSRLVRGKVETHLTHPVLVILRQHFQPLVWLAQKQKYHNNRKTQTTNINPFKSPMQYSANRKFNMKFLRGKTAILFVTVETYSAMRLSIHDIFETVRPMVYTSIESCAADAVCNYWVNKFSAAAPKVQEMSLWMTGRLQKYENKCWGYF